MITATCFGRGSGRTAALKRLSYTPYAGRRAIATPRRYARPKGPDASLVSGSRVVRARVIRVMTLENGRTVRRAGNDRRTPRTSAARGRSVPFGDEHRPDRW